MSVPRPWSQSERGLAFLISNEGFRDTAYPDSKGVWTIGYGTIRVNGAPVVKGMTCTHAQAAEWLQTDCRKFVAALGQFVTVDLEQNQVDALTSFMYNIGGQSFKSSSLRRTINQQQSVTADLFMRWNKVRVNGVLKVVVGLTLRREREFHLFSEGY